MAEMMGRRVRDAASGFKGVVTSRVVYLNGCVQYGVQAAATEDGKLPEIVYLDEGRLKVYGQPVKIPNPTLAGEVSEWPESDDHGDRPGGTTRDVPKT